MARFWAMKPSDYIVGNDQWLEVMGLLPADLEDSCRQKGAMERRREIKKAEDLLRLCFAYGLCDMSLRATAAWAETIDLGKMSDVAVMKRLQKARGWLGHLIGQWLLERGLTAVQGEGQIRIVDATVITKPGSKGTDWRVHLGWDLKERRVTEVEVTDGRGAEKLDRHRVRPGEILMVDAGYVHARGIASVIRRKGHVIVRGHWKNIALYSESGERFDVLAALESLAQGEIGDWQVWIHDGGERFKLRLVGVRKSAEAAEKERKRLRRRASKKKSRLDPRSLAAAAFICILTDVEREIISAPTVLELYRLRWQIELAIKRLKSILHLDDLRAKSAALVQTYLLAKLLAALVIDEFMHTSLSFFPWGYRLLAASGQPVAFVRTVH